MKNKICYLVLFISLVATGLHAEEPNVEDQLAEAKLQLESEQQRNEDLKNQLVMKEEEATRLRDRVSELDNQIELLREQLDEINS